MRAARGMAGSVAGAAAQHGLRRLASRRADRANDLVCDQIVRLAWLASAKKYPDRLRQVAAFPFLIVLGVDVMPGCRSRARDRRIR